MIRQSDAFLEKLLSLVGAEQSNCQTMGMVRALCRAANACIKDVEPHKQTATLQLAKSELEYDLEEAGGLVETLKGIIREQQMKIALLEIKSPLQ